MAKRLKEVNQKEIKIKITKNRKRKGVDHKKENLPRYVLAYVTHQYTDEDLHHSTFSTK